LHAALPAPVEPGFWQLGALAPLPLFELLLHATKARNAANVAAVKHDVLFMCPPKEREIVARGGRD
jgi:hypothetical protein